ncbi:hypothetical protein E8E12_011439 [Didymella heteroderae]|uniref:non-specific serine/threonine protein kinase n=1 Tax=Didymella heteroderae TaxID=1769908 RepID=A0A9P5C564_9PLEO|nr:hypothetical protein E8E12_011439 [Didymella heteroderae]
MLEKLPHHKRIVHSLAPSTEDPEIFAAIFTYYPEGDVRYWMRRRYEKKSVPEMIIWRFFVQMAQALAFIHGDISADRKKPGMMLHRDIKPDNILVAYNGNKYPSFKLIDFQLADVLEKEMPEKSNFLGTYSWQPPENPKINTKAADIWSMGASL